MNYSRNQHHYNHSNRYSHSPRNSKLEEEIRALTQVCQAMREEREQTRLELSRVREELMQLQSNQQRLVPYSNSMDLSNTMPATSAVPCSTYSQPNSFTPAYGDYGPMGVASSMQPPPFMNMNNDMRGKMVAGAIGLGVGALAVLAIGAFLNHMN